MSLTRCIRSDLLSDLLMVIRHYRLNGTLSNLRGCSDRVSNRHSSQSHGGAPQSNELPSNERQLNGLQSSADQNENRRSGPKPIGDFNNCVLVSNSTNIFENLAIEDWLYRHQNFDHNQLLLLWRNTPCVVIGRHQNPWQEVNLASCSAADVSVARRNSGGGTVYHDLNNLNICFFASKRAYNRKQNLELIRQTIQTNFQIDLNINAKEDLILGEEKVSGTASKLAYNKSYHHCTLLVDSDLNDLSRFIRKRSVGKKSPLVATN